MPKRRKQPDFDTIDVDDLFYITTALPAWGIGLNAFLTLTDSRRPSDVPANTMLIEQVLDSCDRVAAVTPPPRYARLHQDLVNALDRTREVLRTVVDGEDVEATMAAVADVAEDLRIVGARIGQELQALGVE